MSIRIQRQRTKGWRMPEGAIYVGRPSRWGNPLPIGTRLLEYNAEVSLRLFRIYADDTRRGWDWLAPLRGHDLACWCPLVDEHGKIVPCHADVLLELANRDEGDRLLAPDREDV
jgi:hypothetical protein